MEIAVGSLVAPGNDRTVLSSGCCAYDAAVVASLRPFVLVSEEGDMVWHATVRPGDFAAVGVASPSAIRNVLDRLARDEKTSFLVGQAWKEALEAQAASAATSAP